MMKKVESGEASKWKTFHRNLYIENGNYELKLIAVQCQVEIIPILFFFLQRTQLVVTSFCETLGKPHLRVTTLSSHEVNLIFGRLCEYVVIFETTSPKPQLFGHK